MSCESTKCIALTDLASHLVLNYNVDCVFFRIVGNLNFFLWFCSMTSVSQSSMLFLLKNTVSRFTPRQLLLESLLHCTKNITLWNPKLAQSRPHCRFPMGNFSMIAVIINIPFISLHFHILSSSPNQTRVILRQLIIVSFFILESLPRACKCIPGNPGSNSFFFLITE